MEEDKGKKGSVVDGVADLGDPFRLHFRVAGVVLVILLAVYGARCVKKGLFEPPEESVEGEKKRKRKNRGTDFTAYYSAGELALKGENIYDYRKSSTAFRPYIYPPTFAVFPMAALSMLEHNWALGVYYVVNVLLLGVALWLLRRLFWKDKEGQTSVFRRPVVGLVCAVLVCGRFLDSNFMLGQANVIILFLLCVSLYWLAEKQGFLSGLGVALATSFKLTPGLFGLYFLWSWRRRAMVGGALGLVLFLLVAPAPVLGFGFNIKLLDAFVAHLRTGEKPSNEKDSDERKWEAVQNQGVGEEPLSVGWAHREGKDKGEVRGIGISLGGTFVKVFSASISLDEEEGRVRRGVNVTDWDPGLVRWIAVGIGLTLVVGTVLVTGGRWAETDVVGMGLSWGLVAQTMLLISPLTRKAHCVVLVIPVVVLVSMLQGGHLTGFTKKAAWVGLLAIGGVGFTSSPEVIGDYLGELVHAYGALTWAMCVFYGVLMVVIVEHKERVKAKI